jgi:Rps23 Pro-64 3,4-dihydroxylase Tpa1-like proline 4-hydroxylase
MEFVYEIPNNLSDEMCEKMIEKFENDDRKRPGVVGGDRKVRPVKTSLDLTVSNYPEWKEIDTYLHKQLQEGTDQYRKHLKERVGDTLTFMFNSSSYDTGYQIQKSVPGNFYSWHDDSFLSAEGGGRFLTFLWYLTTHDPVLQGGGTAIHPAAGDGGKVIKPERGKLLLFPATWTYLHMGLPLVYGDPKYICTGWIHTK